MTECISAEQLAAYRRTALAREQARRQANAERRIAALAAARAAAALLREQYGATRVVLFGSAAHGYWFNEESDIDLVAERIAPDLFWRAWNAAEAIAAGFELNLVAWEEAKPALREAIEREGILL